jgi:hypothetical protein
VRAGWNPRLESLVRAVDSRARLIAEVVTVEDSDVRRVKSEWDAATVSSGSRETLVDGGARIQATTSTAISSGADDGANTTNLGDLPNPFAAVVIEWLDAGAEDREIHTLVARLDPREDGGQPKTVAFWIAEISRITRWEVNNEAGANDFTVEQIGVADPVAAAGEVEADFTFTFQGFSGRRPVVGPAPRDGSFSRPLTLIRILAVDADGAPADNVTWLSNAASGSSVTDSSTYLATHRDIAAAGSQHGEQRGGTAWVIDDTINNMPEFTLSRASYAQTVLTFTGAADFDALTGSDDLVIVARGETPSDSALTFEIDDGGGYVECVDGDVIGEDNTAAGGSDLSGVSTTGPWDMRVTLDPSTSGLNSPVVRDFGIERTTKTVLTRAAEVAGGLRRVDPITLKGNIPVAQIDILKTGERDFRDYGSNLLTAHDIGSIEVRVWIGDPSGDHLARSDWMLDSVWDLEDYANQNDRHRLKCLSPIRRTRIPIPPFIATGGGDGGRDSVEISGTLKECWDELLDTFTSLPARLRGPGVENTTNTALKLIENSDLKDELDAVAYLEGSGVIESQGAVKVVRMMRDTPGDTPVAYFPLGSYTPIEIGPGYSSRVDEFFVPYNWEAAKESFDNERRVFNTLALTALGGVGIDTTGRLADETAKWINSEALADLVAVRAPKHFGSGLITWRIRANDRNPHLEVGDPVLVETDLFVGRSPIDGREIRGPVAAIGIVYEVADFWGRDLGIWIPSLDRILPSTGTVARDLRRTYTKVLSAAEFGGNVGELTPAGTGSGETFYADVALPEGAEIIAMRSKGVRRNAGDTCRVELHGVTNFAAGSPPTFTSFVFATNTHGVDAGAWTEEETTGLTLPWTTDRPRAVEVTLNAASTVTDAKLGWVEIDFKIGAPT